MKGCVQGYGNYEELTTSGVDTTELFDDIEDSRKSPDLVQPDIVIEECDNVEEETDQQDIKSPDHIHLLPTDNTRRRIRLRPSEGDTDPIFNPVLDGASICTAPSMLSLISLPNEFKDKKKINKVTTLCCLLTIIQKLFISTYLTWCQRKKEPMELFLPKRTLSLLKKVSKVIL